MMNMAIPAPHCFDQDSFDRAKVYGFVAILGPGHHYFLSDCSEKPFDVGQRPYDLNGLWLKSTTMTAPNAPFFALFFYQFSPDC